ncbi:branched-chain alpha-keto acid dehydrogenase subunit E2 [Planctomycetes bacterium Pan216]|uniref:Branched-chain alpha-keto acid dehydrogenase subunit E2 n=1 Tax=Kolteria novifilia TaxID=2527975 RepID=A0A518BA42_9BACT|nr:branched-chain alpha-keto acid dehydrogenase subunit E2 [Planctomycetes bacterium Pan216]
MSLPTVPIVVPELGLGPDDALTVSCWLVGVGDDVVEGDRVVELLTGEITFDVASPTSGRLKRIDAETDESVAPGDFLGAILPDRD